MPFRRLGDPLFSLGLWQRFGMGTRITAGGENYEVPAYTNVGGTGDRRATITISTNLTLGGGVVSLLIDGDNTTNVVFLTAEAAAGKFIKWDFGAKKKITEIKLYMSANGEDVTQWKFQGSNNDAAWTDVSGNQGIAGISALPRIMTIASTGYRYVRLFGVSGTIAAAYIREFEFKIGSLLP